MRLHDAVVLLIVDISPLMIPMINQSKSILCYGGSKGGFKIKVNFEFLIIFICV